MEPEDLPWPGELEEEEEEGAENLDEDEVVMVEEMEEEERREPEADFNYESQRRESTDEEDDEEAKAWLQAHPGATLPQASLPRHRYSESELTSPGKVSWPGRGMGRRRAGGPWALCMFPAVCLLLAARHGAWQ